MNLLYERFQSVARSNGTTIALAKGDSVTTFAELLDLAGVLAPRLAAAEVGPGRPLVLAAPNGPEVAASVVAAWSLGSLPVFVSPHAPAGHLELAVRQSHAAARLTETEGLAPCDPRERHPELGPEIGSVVFTSGSTGRPKGVMQTQESLIGGAERIGRLNGYEATDRILCPVPWSHDYGWGQLLTCLLLGIGLVLPAVDGVQGLSDAIERHRPSILAGTPSVFAGMVYGISNIRTADLTSLRKVTSTGSNLSPELVDELLVLLPGAAVYSNYGLTETYRSCCLTPEFRKGRERSVGRPVEGVEILIVGPDNQPLPPGEVGQVVHRGAGGFAAYLGDADRTAASRYDTQAVLTGDMGWLDVEGFLYLKGRRDRMIKSMDVLVGLDEVEHILIGSRLLRQIGVIARPHKVIGMKIEAHVVLKDAEEAAALKAFARQNLSKYQMPREFFFVDALPMTASGKIDYLTLSRDH